MIIPARGARSVVHAARQLIDEQVGEPVPYAVEQCRGIVRGLVEAGGGDHDDAARPSRLGQRLRPPPQAVRRPLHDRTAAKLTEEPQLFDRRRHVVQLLAAIRGDERNR
ncbi:MAG TPA: hypothetical protein VGD53_24065 [Actinoallomurus sp.]